MIGEQMQSFVIKLIQKTNSNEIMWKILKDLPNNEKGFPDLMTQAREKLLLNEFRWLLIENSFYFRHQEGIVALLRIDNQSGRDNSHSDEFTMLLQIRKNSPIHTCNLPGLQEDFSVLYMAILDYLNKDVRLPDDLYKFMQSC